VNVADDPVAACSMAGGKIVPADGFSLAGKRLGEVGCG
jgi:hypothetical protein